MILNIDKIDSYNFSNTKVYTLEDDYQEIFKKYELHRRDYNISYPMTDELLVKGSSREDIYNIQEHYGDLTSGLYKCFLTVVKWNLR